MQTIQKVLQFFIDLMNDAIGILVSLALLGFLWGILGYFINAESPVKRKESSKFMLYGLLSLVVITGVWGFVNLLGQTIGTKVGDTQSDLYEYWEDTGGLNGDDNRGTGELLRPIDDEDVGTIDEYWEDTGGLQGND